MKVWYKCHRGPWIPNLSLHFMHQSVGAQWCKTLYEGCSNLKAACRKGLIYRHHKNHFGKLRKNKLAEAKIKKVLLKSEF